MRRSLAERSRAGRRERLKALEMSIFMGYSALMRKKGGLGPTFDVFSYMYKNSREGERESS